MLVAFYVGHRTYKQNFKQDPNAGSSRVAVCQSRGYKNTISDTSEQQDDGSGSLSINSQGVTSY